MARLLRFIVGCLLLGDFISYAQSAQLSNISRFSSLRDRYNDSYRVSPFLKSAQGSQGCTERRFLTEYPCGGEDDSFRKMRKTSNIDVCIYYSKWRFTYHMHLKKCVEYGEHVTTFCPNQLSLFTAARQLRIRGEDYWIDYSDIKEEGQWRCGNGTNPQTFYFISGNPDNAYGNQDCALMLDSSDGYIDDDVCSKSYPFLCIYHYNRDYRVSATMSDHPTEVNIGGTAVINCKVMSPPNWTNHLHLVAFADGLSTVTYKRHHLVQKPHDPRMLWTYPEVHKTVKGQEFLKQKMPICLRRLSHSFYIEKINWDFLKFSWKCCSRYGCSKSADIDIEVYPQAPLLNVEWPSDTGGELYSGEYLIANCSAYVGGFRPVLIRWELETKTRTFFWHSHPTIANDLDYGVELYQIPYRESCPGKEDFRNNETGVCYHLTRTPHSITEAYKICEDFQRKELKSHWTLLSMEPDERLFMLISDHLSDDLTYWIGLNDSSTENEFYWENGLKTSKSDWGDLWIDDSQVSQPMRNELHCAFLDKRGIHVHQNCSVSRLVICNSQERFTTSMMDFPTGIDDGPFYTSFIKIKHRKSMASSTLSCLSHHGNSSKVKETSARKKISLKATSSEVTFDWGTHKPSLQVTLDANSTTLITATCDAHLANDSRMTWIFRMLPGATTQWVVHINGTVEGDSPNINVSIVSAQESDDFGNDITSAMMFHYSKKYEGASIKCLPYDGRTGLAEHILSHDENIVAVHKFPAHGTLSGFQAGGRFLVLLLLVTALSAAFATVLLTRADDSPLIMKASSQTYTQENSEAAKE